MTTTLEDVRAAHKHLLWEMKRSAFAGPPLSEMVQREDFLLTTIARMEREIARMRRNLNGRDDYIVAKGLWTEFVGTLPRALPTEDGSK